jgi:peptide chain release factor subunit 3
MPATEIFEADIDVLDLVEFKPILTKGYTCMMHIHTYHDEVTIKDIVKAWEKNDRGEVTEKMKPQFVRSQTRIICRIQTKGPVSLEKFDVMQQMGRFTLRDEGKTICVGKVLKYKPYDMKKMGTAAAATTGQTAGSASAPTQSSTVNTG